jgi:hypothetical protein
MAYKEASFSISIFCRDRTITKRCSYHHQDRTTRSYHWLLRKNGFKVSDTGYWFYANATKDREAFDARLDFELTLVPYKGDDSWVDSTLVDLKHCLDSDDIPPSSEECDYCRYREAAGVALRDHMQQTGGKNLK